MFNIGDFVINSNNGICEITDTVTMNMSGENKEYYLLIPIEEKTAKVYIPVSLADQKIRLTMTEKEARHLISNVKHIETLYLENEKERERTYKEALLSRDPKRLVGIIKTLYLRKQARLESGKKNTAVDERYFKLAEQQLYSELAFVLKISKPEVITMITENV